MGKATKWILNLLMGRREEKSKKTLENTCILGTPIVMSPSPMDTADVIIRRRWSFKRSTSKKPITYRKNRSFDSTIPMPLYHTHRMLNVFNLHVAASKIQAVYRSYLARRALRALRGLVKLQALARGHLVRKQMNGVLRSMHAVMAIQVRARIHRIQLTDEPPAAAIMFRRRKSDYREASDRHLRKQEQDNIADNWNNFPTSRVLRSRSSRLSVSQRERQPKMSPSSSTLTFTDEFSSSTTYDRQVDEFSFKMGQRGFRQHSVHCPDYMPSDSNFSPPNYMNNTKSSKAKARSHSEPRQRPKLGTKQKSRRTSSSMDAKNDKKNQYPWLIKLYRSDRSSTYDEECNTNNSDMSVIQFEPPMDLY